MSEMPRSRIRVGVVGVGNWASHAHLPVLSLLAGIRMTVLQTRRRDVAEAAAARFGVPHVVDTPGEVATHPDVDLVLVPTTTPQHEDTVRLAVAAGKHVYSEWPLATNVDVAVALQVLADRARVRHFIGLQRRLAPSMRYLRDLITARSIQRMRRIAR